MNMNTSAGHGAINSELSAFLGSSVGALNVFHVSFFRRVFLIFFFWQTAKLCGVRNTLQDMAAISSAAPPLSGWMWGRRMSGWRWRSLAVRKWPGMP